MPQITRKDAERALAQNAGILAAAHVAGVTVVVRNGKRVPAVLAIFAKGRRPANLPANLEARQPGRAVKKVRLIARVGPPLRPDG